MGCSEKKKTEKQAKEQAVNGFAVCVFISISQQTDFYFLVFLSEKLIPRS
jgi:hypothetical protein